MFDFKNKEVLSIAMGGTNGNGTTAELIERVLTHNQRRTNLSGHRSRPVCSVVDGGKDISNVFTPCTVLESLVKAVSEAARHAASGDVVLLSPACSSLEQFRNYQERGEIFCRTVQSISRGVEHRHPNMNDKIEPKQNGK